MKTRHSVRYFIVALSLFGLSALSNPAAMAGEISDILVAAKNATTRSEHEAIAKYYENAAGAMQAKMWEQQQLLEHYEEKSYLYGRQAQDLQSRAEALARKYKQAVIANAREAHLHYQMAMLAKADSNPASNPQKLTEKLTAVQSHHNRFTAE